MTPNIPIDRGLLGRLIKGADNQGGLGRHC
nr:MAG TPA: hypothetical protein [Caudoviricetes sp.]